jgi:2Fe-2S iron-sulfur cluster binding domain
MPNSTPSLAPGHPAPPLRVRRADASTLTLASGEREPIVLAVLDAWSLSDEDDDTMEAVRTELRGLGAVLVALTRDALWCFRPEDETQTFAKRSELDAGDVAALRASYGLSPEGDALGLFVIDAGDTIRFAHVAAPQDFQVPGEVLLAALSAAGRALLVPRPRSGLVSRRELVAACLVVGFAVVLLDACEPAPPSLPPGPVSGVFATGLAPPGTEVDITLDVNGSTRTVRVHPSVSLLDVLRDPISAAGTRMGCGHGQCGECTVLVSGRRANACQTLAVAVQGAKITTIEGLARGAELHPARPALVADEAPRYRS